MPIYKPIIPTIFFILLLFSVFPGCEDKDQYTAPATAKGNLSELMNSMNIMPINEPMRAPEFELPSINGDVKSLREYRGNVVLLSFWATW